MTTRRIVLETDPATGKPLSFKQLMSNRGKLERDRRIQQRKEKEQQAIDAVLSPPAPPPTFRELMAQHKAQDEGRQLAQYKAEQEAAANRGPVNHYRQQAEALQGQLYRGPIIKKQFDRLNELADKWDREQVAAAEAAAKQAAIDNDPMVKLARDYAAGQMKLAPDEFKAEAAECAGIAQAGDAALAWQRMKALDEKIWQAADKLAVEARMGKATSDATFAELATTAEQARERAEQSAAMVEAAE
jgi:major membrane immunogen (membrane-anchored lipoprotein)